MFKKHRGSIYKKHSRLRAGAVAAMAVLMAIPTTAPAHAQATGSSPIVSAVIAPLVKLLARPAPKPPTGPNPLPPVPNVPPVHDVPDLDNLKPSPSPSPTRSTPPASAKGSDGSTQETIMAVFGTQEGPRAVRVARCESRLNVQAKSSSGAYQGLFQMGGPERKRFGHGPDARTQAAAAHRYFKTSGWSPWARSKKCWGA